MNKRICALAIVACAMLGNSVTSAQTTAPVTTAAVSNSDAMKGYFIDTTDPYNSATVCGEWFNQNAGSSPGRATIQSRTQTGIDALGTACYNYYLAVVQGAGKTQPDAFIADITPTGNISFKLDALLFAQVDNETAMDRMRALRGAQQGSSSTAMAVKPEAVGGGASADQSAELFSKKLGVWFRGNTSNGNKDVTLLTGKLDNSQTGFAAGMDYRVGNNLVLGGMLGYRSAKAKFGDGGAAGNMDSKTTSFSAYVSSYLYKDLYLDGVINYGSVKYDTRRNVTDLSAPPVTSTAVGNTNGNTLSGSIAMGYEFAVQSWTIAPALSYHYADSHTDAFTEEGSGAFDLDYGKQHYHSSSAHLELNVSDAINGGGAVWIPHFRAELIKEFGANVDTFDVRFVNASDSSLAPLPIQMDKLDDLYYRVSLGVSAQFRNDVSGYLEYQQLIGFDQVSYHNIALGVRLQF